MSRPRVYLDHAASAPLRRSAVEAMSAAMGVTGNPASLHGSGRRARALLEDAREDVADALGAHPTEVVFTSGGSESDAIAVLGGWRARRETRPRVIVGATEHPAVIGVTGEVPGTVVAAVDADGRLDVEALAARLGDDVGVVSVQGVNNETGTVQPIAGIAGAAHRHGAWFHTDAVQAAGHLRVDFGGSGADLASVSAHKVGGPVGVGALLVRREVRLPPYGLGGRQEGGVRSGTQAVMLAVGFAAALREAESARETESARLAGLRARLVDGIVDGIVGVRVNGGVHVSPAIVNLTFEGTRADDVLLLLDREGIDASTGSACRAGVHQPSDVLLAMGRTVAEAGASIRFSLGHTTGAADIERLLGVLPGIVATARDASGYAAS
ncbi:MAG: cysteine desulfurase family protein [Propionibacterium sp.]|nr:cysteine desulfurase family protein [Propionibacterium sp.]